MCFLFTSSVRKMASKSKKDSDRSDRGPVPKPTPTSPPPGSPPPSTATSSVGTTSTSDGTQVNPFASSSILFRKYNPIVTGEGEAPGSSGQAVEPSKGGLELGEMAKALNLPPVPTRPP